METIYRVTPLRRKKGKKYIVQRVVDRKQIGKSFELKSQAKAYELELIANNSPAFVNLNSFPETIASGDTLQFNLDWQDSDDDIITFGIEEDLEMIMDMRNLLDRKYL